MIHLFTDRVHFPRWNRGASLAWQTLGTVLVWCYVVALHVSNDGLWYQADSSRHAINGAFWWDFLGNLPTSPFGFAVGYYARYPVINPVAYPPFFYLLEGMAYQFFGMSPMVAKGLVLVSLIFGAGYVAAWLRRWVAPEAGWAALVFVLQPGMIMWSHAVMLNVPSMALAVAALYHARRWLEAPSSRHVYAAAGFGTIAVLTYLPIAVLIPIVLLWAIVQRRLFRMFNVRTLIILAVPATVVIAWVLLAVPWAQSQAAVAQSVGQQTRWTVDGWLYYPAHLSEIVSVPILILAGLGLGITLLRPSRRRELLLCLSWLGTSYIWFSLITPGFAEARYFLLAVPALVWLATLGVASLLDGSSRPRLTHGIAVAACLALFALHLGIASHQKVREVRGFQDVASYVRAIAPNERIFYDGQYDGVFAVYLRALDPGLSQAITRGSNLIYSTRLSPRYGLVEHVTAEADITDVLVRECGCRVFVVETQLPADTAGVRAARNVRTVLQNAPFVVLHRFPVSTPDVHEIVVYRLTTPAATQTSVRLRFPFLDSGKTFDVAPIKRTNTEGLH